MSTSVEISDDAAALAASVAARLLDQLADLQAAGSVPAIALTGGGIADAVHRELALQSAAAGVDWGAVDIWWGDERFVAADSEDRNAGQARATFLDAVGATGPRVHEMPSDTGQSVDEAAAAYADELRRSGSGRFDIVMLGLGPDGHIASLFPGYPQLDVDDRIAVGVVDSPKPPPLRVSLTFSALARTREVWFLVSGDGKAEAAARALAGVVDDRPRTDPHEIPAAGVTAEESITWFLDTEAASRLPQA